MAKRSSNPFQLLQLSTDFPALLAIAIGIGIAIFIDNTAIRLIGICVSVLGGVGLFVLLGQRTRDIPPEGLRTIRIQEQPNFRTIIKKEDGAKRLVFDDFTESVFADDPLANKIEQIPQEEQSTPSLQQTSIEEEEQSISSPSAVLNIDTNQSPEERVTPVKKLVFDDFSDDFSEISLDTSSSQQDISVSLPSPIPTHAVEEHPTSPSSDSANQSSSTELFDLPTTLSSTQPIELSTSISAIDNSMATHASPPTNNTSEENELSAPEESFNTTTPLGAIALETMPLLPEEQTPPTHHDAAHQNKDSDRDEESPSSTHKRLMFRVQTQDFSEENLPADRDEPRLEFDFLLQRVLRVIRSVIPARTVLFAWVNAERAELIIEEKISDIPDALISGATIPIGNDVLSQIGVIAKPEILTEINPSAELDLLPYYHTPSQTRSFVGVPIMYDGVVIGILTSDTNEDDAYDESTVLFLGHFTRLLSGLIHSYNDKYDLMQSARIVAALEKFRSMLHQRASREELCSAALDALHERLPHCFSMAVVCANNQGTWHIARVHSASEQQQRLQGVNIDLQYSLVGKTILHSYLQEMLPVAGNTIRLSNNEAQLEQSYCTAVPIISSTYCYGALVIEEDALTMLTRQDIRLAEAIADAVGSLLEQQTLRTLLASNALHDNTTGLLNAPAFIQRAEEEFIRAKYFMSGISCAMLALDEYAALNLDADPALESLVLSHIITIIRKHTREFDIIARYDRRVLSVLFIQKSLHEAHIIAERIRKDAAMTLLHYQGRQLAATVSIGVAELVQQHSARELLDHAGTALSVAQQKANAVSMYA